MLTLKNINFKYQKDGPDVLAGVSLDVKPGERVLVVGKNGAGKTTLSKTMCGLLPGVETRHGFLDGQVLYEGKDLSSYSRKEIVSEIAILFQDFESQIVSSSVLEELLFYPANIGIGYRDALAAVQAMSRRFGITGLLKRDIGGLSGGEKQKTAFFSLLSVAPSILILDEPFTDMEPSSQERILEFVKQDVFTGAIVLFEQALEYYRYFDRIVVLHEGRIMYDGGREVVHDAVVLGRAGLAVPALSALCRGAQTVSECAETISRSFKFDSGAYESVVKATRREKSAPLLEARRVRFSYKGAAGPVFENVSLTVEQGDCIAVLGPNGSGKTTLTKLLAGILSPGSGEVLYKGAPVVCGDIGYVYQNPDNQIFAETVFDEVAFALRMKKTGENEVRARVTEILASLGLSNKSLADPFSLPKGDRQKIACASVLASRPEILILDEPTTGLDFPSLSEMMEIIADLNNRGTTVLMITHCMEAAALFSRTVLAVADGSVLFYGPSRDFFNRENLVSATHARRTGVMDLSVALNGTILMNAGEFQKCWKRKETEGL